MGVRRSRSGALSLGARMRPLRQAGGSSAAASASPGVGEIGAAAFVVFRNTSIDSGTIRLATWGEGQSQPYQMPILLRLLHPLWQVREQVQQEHLCSCDNRCQHWPKG